MSAYCSVAPCRAPRYPLLLLQRSHHWQSYHTHILRIHTTLFRMFFHNSLFMALHFLLRKRNCMYKRVRVHTQFINPHPNRCRVLALMVSRSKTMGMALGVQVGRGTQCHRRARSAFLRESVNGSGVARWNVSPTVGGRAVVRTAGTTIAERT